MAKYKQIVIPEVNKDFSNLSLPALRAEAKSYYAEHFQGQTVINAHLNLPVTFTSLGKNKTTQGGAFYSKKAAAMLVLDQLITHARYNNFGSRKPSDPVSVIGYLNFKAKMKINGKTEFVRIAVVQKTDGRFYYNQEVNVIKNPPSSVRKTTN